jgi:hypothetical protein
VNSVVLSGAAGIVLSGAPTSCYQVRNCRLSHCSYGRNRFRNSYNKKSYGFLITPRKMSPLWITQRPCAQGEKPVIISFVSQKGGVGKTHPARLTIDLTPVLRGRIKVVELERSLTVAEMLRGPLQREFDRISEAP